MQYSAGDQFECFRHNGTYATVLFSLLKFVFFVFFLKIVFFSQKCVFFELCVFCVCFSQNHAKRLCFVCVSFLNTLACVCFVCVFVLMPSPVNNPMSSECNWPLFRFCKNKHESFDSYL